MDYTTYGTGFHPDKTYSRHNELSGCPIPYYDAYETTRTAERIVADLFRLFMAKRPLSRQWFKTFSRPGSFSSKHPATQLVTHYLANNIDLRRVPGYPVFEDKVDHYLDVFNLMCVWDEDKPHISIEAETQWGKTILCVVCLLFYKAYLVSCYMKTRDKGRQIKHKEMIWFCTMNRNAVTDTATRDYEACQQLLGDIWVDAGDRPPITLFEATTEFDADQGRYASAKRSDAGKAIIKRTAQRNFDPYLRRAIEGGFTHVTLLIDEADSATNINSILSKTIAKFDRSGIKLRFIAMSATPKMYAHLGKFRRHQITIKDTNYSGLFQGTRTPIYGLTHFCKLAKINPDQPEIKLIGDIMKAVLKGVSDPNPEYPQYPNAKLNGLPFNGGSGMMVRFDRTSDAEVILAKYGKWLRDNDIHVLRYYTNYFKKQIVNGVCLEGYKNQSDLIHAATERAGVKRFILIMIDSGRRGDRIPAECTANIDLAAKFTTETSAEQGTIGRIAGWFKIDPDRSSFVLISDHNKAFVDLVRSLYDDNGVKTTVMKVAHNTITDYFARSTERSAASFNAADPEISELASRINRMVLPHVIATKEKTPEEMEQAEIRRQIRKANGERPNKLHSTFRIEYGPAATVHRPSKRGDARDHVHIGRERRPDTASRWFFPLLDAPMCDYLDRLISKRFGSPANVLRPGDGQYSRTDHETPKRLNCHPKFSNYVNVSVGNIERKGHRSDDELVHIGQRTSGGRGVWGKPERVGASVRQSLRDGFDRTINLQLIKDPNDGRLYVRQINIALVKAVVVKPDGRMIAKQITLPKKHKNLYSKPLFMNAADSQTHDAMELAKLKVNKRSAR